MPDNESSAARYRRLARECIATASTPVTEQTRATLVEMAQVWMRLAESHDARPATQQQQQIQPTRRRTRATAMQSAARIGFEHLCASLFVFACTHTSAA
jgi:hypothetical protein